MTRSATPTHVDLTRPHDDWRSAPMPASTAPLDLVRLDSATGVFAIYARFPPGFARAVRGGYDASEEFVVLDGSLVLDGTALVRGDLTHVPAGAVREGMHTDEGCTVVAWFTGRADFRAPEELTVTPSRGTTTLPALGATPGVLLDAPEATWWVCGADRDPAPTDDVLDPQLRTWSRGDVPTGRPLLVRTPTPR